MMNTYSMLAMNNENEDERVARKLDFVVAKLQGKSGYFYGRITGEDEIRPDKMIPEFQQVYAMVRKNCDALLWMVKLCIQIKG